MADRKVAVIDQTIGHYHWIIDDVLSHVKPDFVQEGINE